ncbi:hypothetical protein MMC31_005637 [Peltigera leucophlebia]|nr:hypothetical protein [Peltigera leucophlebia]
MAGIHQEISGITATEGTRVFAGIADNTTNNNITIINLIVLQMDLPPSPSTEYFDAQEQMPGEQIPIQDYDNHPPQPPSQSPTTTDGLLAHILFKLGSLSDTADSQTAHIIALEKRLKSFLLVTGETVKPANRTNRLSRRPKQWQIKDLIEVH